MFFLPKLNQKGAIPLLLLVAVLGIIGFLAFSSFAPFKDKLLTSLYPKPSSHASSPDEDIKGLTLAAFQLANEHSQAPADKKAEVLGRLASNLKARQEKMLQLIENNPEVALKIGLSKAVKNQFPDNLQSLVEEPTEITGELEVLHSDEIDTSDKANPHFTNSRFYYFLKTQDQGKVQLFFAENVPAGLATDTKVKVKGLKLNDKMAINGADSNNFTVLLSSTNVLGTQTTRKVAVIMANFQNNTTQSMTADQARSVTFTGTNSVNAFYKEGSFGKLTLEGFTRPDGDIFGWYTIPYDYVGCETNYSAWGTAAEAAAVANGFVRTNYQTIIYAFPPSSTCTWSGLGSVSGSSARIWMFGYYDLPVVGHEMGHNLNTHHASSLNCLDSTGKRVPISTSCTSSEYGDPFDIMGDAWGHNHMNNYHKGNAKFLDATNTNDATTDGEYLISPIEQLTGVTSLRIPKEYSSTGTVTKYYYLEARQAGGFESFTSSSPVANGLTIRVAPPYTTVVQSQLIDTTPATTTYADAPLLVGKTFEDTTRGLVVNLLSKDTSSARVKLTFGSTVCASANPTVNISPLGQYGNPGQTLSYTLTVTNNDSSACAPATFNLSSSLPAGFSQTSALNALTLASAASGTMVVSVTSDTSMAAGFYSLTETLTNSSDSAFTKSVSANYNVNSVVVPSPSPSPTPSPTPGETIPPSVSITSPANGAVIARNSSFTVSADAADNVAVAKVEFSIDGGLKCSNTTSPYSCTTKVGGKPNATHTITAKAYDAAGNMATSSITIKTP